MVKSLPAIPETQLRFPRSGRSPGEGNDNPFQYSCLENPLNKGAWWATVCGVSKRQTCLSNKHFHFLVPADTPLREFCSHMSGILHSVPPTALEIDDHRTYTSVPTSIAVESKYILTWCNTTFF